VDRGTTTLHDQQVSSPFGLSLAGLSRTTLSGLNVFFNFRSPAPTVVPLVLLLIAYPFGKFLAFTLPITTYRIPIPTLPAFISSLPPHPSTLAPLSSH